jgi:hypothetical protein
LSKDTADVVLADLNESLITPGGSPRVLDEEVVLAILSTIANGKDTMVKSGTTSGASNDTTSVALEGSLVSLDGNRDGRIVQSSLKLATRSVLDIMVGGGTNNTL